MTDSSFFRSRSCTAERTCVSSSGSEAMAEIRAPISREISPGFSSRSGISSPSTWPIFALLAGTIPCFQSPSESSRSQWKPVRSYGLNSISIAMKLVRNPTAAAVMTGKIQSENQPGPLQPVAAFTTIIRIGQPADSREKQ